MALMVGSLYDALRSADVAEEKARRAAEDVADFDKRVGGVDASIAKLEQKIDTRFEWVDGRFTLLQWMLAFNLALTTPILFRLFSL